MRFNFNSLAIFLYLVVFIFACAKANPKHPSSQEKEMTKLDNPMTVQYLKQNLHKSQPRLVLNTNIEKELLIKLKSDPVVQNLYKAIQKNAELIQSKPLLERKLQGRRLLSVSREMLYRINMLGMVYRIEKNQKVLKRINEEVVAVCNFSDWNPSHYLDVAEMSMAVAFALDWTAGKLPNSTINLALNSLIEKGIKPSYNAKGNTGWIKGSNNWNQVCNGGMIAASIAIAEKDPELAAKTISRSLDGMPYSLKEYAPDGVYPEGSTYWGYGTSFSVVTSAMLESAFGTDFGLADYPAFQKSAVFRVLMNTPSGWYFNFADCGDKRSEGGDVTLAWFATKTGNKAFFERERFLLPATDLGELSRISGAALVWISQYKEKEGMKIPTAWKGDGSNPIVIFTGGENDTRGYYFGGKGGRGTTSHGNMDAGSFIFELDGERWVVDPGNQSYNEVEQAGFDLWGNCQECQRWILLTKNNFGHSTVSVNNSLFVNNGYAALKDFKDGAAPEATFDMTAVYGENMKSASRRFLKENNQSILIEDNF
ncbi:MAG TPA: heparinase II/III family protein, partial [Prolixibacteraceae bacterium]|nr:heparinase II/III family protein [Prolixibacteraceae bacterium]